MTTESVRDAFERRYMAAFQAKAAAFGVIVRYERDRAARDIGIHFFRKTQSGAEEATGSLVWFQMKGILSSTLSATEFDQAVGIPIRIKAKDLQLWFRTNGPTYLAVFIESKGIFLIFNVLDYIERRFGKSIFEVKQKTVEIKVPTTSVLDEQAFQLLIRKGAVEEWRKVLEADDGELHLCQRDFSVIWRLGTADQRGVEHRMDVTDWQSKLRGEVYFQEKDINEPEEEWLSVRNHWQYRLRIEDIQGTYPYLDLEAFDEDWQSDVEFWGNEDNQPFVELADGTVIYGRDVSGEYNSYELRPKLNSLGLRLFALARALLNARMIEAPSPDDAEMIDIAPWHHRDV